MSQDNDVLTPNTALEPTAAAFLCGGTMWACSRTSCRRASAPATAQGLGALGD